MRRTPLKRSTPLRASSGLNRAVRLRARGDTKYRRRERDFDFMGFVKRQPCIVRSLPPFLFVGDAARAGKYKATPCSGCVEADHAGARGIGQKADDRTCIPLCSSHHNARTNHKGEFFHMTRDELRAWRAAAIQRTQAAWEGR